ncbi:MAG: filament integrity protein FraC [Microcoleaceae cyanobacterium]
MEPTVLIARVFLSRALSLLISIHIEAFVFRTNLRFTPRESVKYATAVNLFAEIIGYFIFFSIFLGASEDFQFSIMSYLSRYQMDQFSVNLLSIIIFYFLLFLLVKIQGFEILKILVNDDGFTRSSRGSNTLATSPVFMQGIVSRFKTVLRAHTVSYLANMLILVLQVSIRS